MIDIDKLTVGELKELVKLAGCAAKKPKGSSHSIPVGQAVFIRTVTHYYTGRVKTVTASDIVLTDAAWIADSGRYNTALKTGSLNEVEPIPEYVIIGRGGIIDIVPWAHALPKDQK